MISFYFWVPLVPKVFSPSFPIHWHDHEPEIEGSVLFWKVSKRLQKWREWSVFRSLCNACYVSRCKVRKREIALPFLCRSHMVSLDRVVGTELDNCREREHLTPLSLSHSQDTRRITKKSQKTLSSCVCVMCLLFKICCMFLITFQHLMLPDK